MKILKPLIENLAERLAASKGGRIAPADLIPYIPLSLTLVRRFLDEMVDGNLVISERKDGLLFYEFTELVGAPAKVFPKGICLYCGESVAEGQGNILAAQHQKPFQEELLKLAESEAWPAEAIWQHELIYITSNVEGPIRISDVAGRSRLTLSQVNRRLEILAKEGYARQNLDFEKEKASYEFPKVDYPAEAYFRNDRFIRQHPSSLKDEAEVKMAKTLIMLIAIVFIGLLAAIGGVPFPLIALGAIAGGAFTIFKVFMSKLRIEPEQIDAHSLVRDDEI